MNAKSFRYFTRYLSSRPSDLKEEESRITFVTDGCSVEELEKIQDLVGGNLEVREHFVSEEEEDILFKEVEPYLKRQKYQYDHWDDVSVTTRNLCLLELVRWYPHAQRVIPFYVHSPPHPHVTVHEQR